MDKEPIVFYVEESVITTIEGAIKLQTSVGANLYELHIRFDDLPKFIAMMGNVLNYQP